MIFRGRAVCTQDFVFAIGTPTKSVKQSLIANTCRCGMQEDKKFDKAQQPWKRIVALNGRPKYWPVWCRIACHGLWPRLPKKKGEPGLDKSPHYIYRGVFTSNQSLFNQGLVSRVGVMLQGRNQQLTKHLQVARPWLYRL
mmetsp:Transcript_86179/g.180275  ORF Transcript_86179/g.180275 Transcript_86179/m.180275 type:complete len:140 (+) Transcript_86179:489-908(+)